MKIDRIDHFVLTVRDPEATCAFYSRVLGMHPVTFAGGRKALAFGNQKINLHQAGREFERPRDWLRHGLALLAALLLVGVVLMGFDAFLTAMQKFMEAQAVDPAPAATAAQPIQAYAVEGEVSPPPPADPGPRPSPAQAPESAPATP